MRINVYVALATGMSRRNADEAIAANRVKINNQTAKLGDNVLPSDSIELDGLTLAANSKKTILLNKPVGYVCSRNGQGSKTIYDLLPKELHHLKPVGRLDKNSSGLLLLTDDGQLAHQLTHPSFNKQKVYEIVLDNKLEPVDKQKIESGVKLQDGLSRLKLNGIEKVWLVTMTEGRNRQIRRTFSALGYEVVKLHRTEFGNFKISELTEGKYLIIS